MPEVQRQRTRRMRITPFGVKRGSVGLASALRVIHAGAQCTKLVVAADPAYPPLHW